MNPATTTRHMVADAIMGQAQRFDLFAILTHSRSLAQVARACRWDDVLFNAGPILVMVALC